MRQKKRSEKTGRSKSGNKRHTLIAGILRNFAICLLLIIGGILLVDSLGERSIDRFWDHTDISYILSQMKYLKNGEYDKIKQGGGRRYTGYFEIVDARANVIYCSRSDIHNKYNQQTLFFIPESKIDETFYTEKVDSRNGESFLITRYSMKGDDTRPTGVIVFKNDGSVVYDSVGIDEKKLDPATIKILIKNSKSTFIQKRQFKTSTGETRYLLYHQGNRNKLQKRIQNSVTDISLIADIAIVAIGLVLFSISILRMIRRPVKTISGKMEEFGRTGEVNVKGDEIRRPVEFQNIMDSLGSLEQQLVASEDKRHEMESQRQKMLTDISHDLRTPATVIQGYAEMLVNTDPSPEEREKYSNIILKRSMHLTDLINTFFEYSKLDYPDVNPELVRDDFCEFFREYFADRYAELEAGGSTITVEIPEEEMYLTFDHLLMKRLFENIIGNSIKHNGGHVPLYAELSQTDDEIIVRIGDNGRGIESNLRETVFTPFVVGNEARTGGNGTGLGLAIAKRIVEIHHGSIILLPEGTDGWETLFEIRIPKDGGQQDA